MKRKERLMSRGNGNSRRLRDTAYILDKAMESAGVKIKEREPFLDWAVGTLWKTFKEERMNQRLVIENQIRHLGLRFPNGTVKKGYKTEFHLPVELISDIWLEGAEEAGLELKIDDTGECILSGVPCKSGDFNFVLHYRTVEGEPDSSLSIPIAFNPNPRDLWKNIATHKDIPYYKKDSEEEFIRIDKGEGTAPIHIVAASQRGRSHAQEGKARDDHFGIYHCEKSDWIIIAVADGAGSARFSRKGSEVACKTVLEYCKSRLEDNPEFEECINAFHADMEDSDKRSKVTQKVIDIVYTAAKKAHEAIMEVSLANEESGLRDYATTLMFAICKKYDFGWFISSFWVGDGAMCAFDAKGEIIKLLGTPDEGEYSGQTRFLTMPEIFHDRDVIQKRLRMSIVKDMTALFLMSDGVSDPMFETDRNLGDYRHWAEFYSSLKTGFPDDEIPGVDFSDENPDVSKELLGWLDFWSPGNHDDRTIAILY